MHAAQHRGMVLLREIKARREFCKELCKAVPLLASRRSRTRAVQIGGSRRAPLHPDRSRLSINPTENKYGLVKNAMNDNVHYMDITAVTENGVIASADDQRGLIVHHDLKFDVPTRHDCSGV